MFGTGMGPMVTAKFLASWILVNNLLIRLGYADTRMAIFEKGLKTVFHFPPWGLIVGNFPDPKIIACCHRPSLEANT
jgi:hypothetical protein